MTQEKTDLYVGLQLGQKGAGLTCYSSEMKEPVTVSVTDEKENFHILVPEGVWECADGTGDDLGVLKDFLKNCLSMVPGYDRQPIVKIMVTVPKLASPLDERIPEALEQLGIERRYIFLQDFSASFYYYTINQKKELWLGDVALMEYEDEGITGHVLHIDRATKPATVTVKQIASQKLDRVVRDEMDDESWDRERDRLFYELLKKVFERRFITTSFLLGDYFDKSWAQRSFQYLTFHRHAFQGKNLYSKGACYAAMERFGLLPKPDLLFMGVDIIHENIGMNLKIRGKETYYPMISAGINWYEAHHVCELIPDQENGITILSRTMTQGQEVEHILRFKDMPKRPNRATRLRLTVYFVSAKRCVIEVEDLGFGELYRSSGKKWKREIVF